MLHFIPLHCSISVNFSLNYIDFMKNLIPIHNLFFGGGIFLYFVVGRQSTFVLTCKFVCSIPRVENSKLVFELCLIYFPDIAVEAHCKTFYNYATDWRCFYIWARLDYGVQGTTQGQMPLRTSAILINSVHMLPMYKWWAKSSIRQLTLADSLYNEGWVDLA